MRELELRTIQPRRFVPRTTDSRHGQQMSPNLLLERELKVERPRQVIVGDITYLPLQGWRVGLPGDLARSLLAQDRRLASGRDNDCEPGH